MRKVLFFIVLLMALFLSGCGNDIQQVENDVTEVSMSRGDNNFFLSVGLDKKDISTEDFFSVRGPLVNRKIIQDENGKNLQIVDYEYDDKNRYIRSETSQYNSETGSVDVILIDEYSYDEFFSYHIQYTMPERQEVFYEVKDTHDNVILLKIKRESDLEIFTYTYDYTCDTNLRHEEYCYRGEGLVFSYYLASSYNKNGDEISCIIQDSNDEYTLYSTEYEYDEDNRIVKKFETKTDQKNAYYTFLNEITEYISEYSYNDAGLLECEIYTVIFNKGSYDESEDERVVKIYYEYDSEKRLIKEVHEGVQTQIILYEYDVRTISDNEVI